jgi:hypothetical protein
VPDTAIDPPAPAGLPPELVATMIPVEQTTDPGQPAVPPGPVGPTTIRVAPCPPDALECSKPGACDGEWVTFADPRTVKAGDRRRIFGRVTDAFSRIGQGFDVVNGVCTVLITGWSYGLPTPTRGLEAVPVPRDILDELEIATYDRITSSDPVTAAMRRMFPDMSPSGKADSPTVPSGGSTSA